jgi:long-chain fatty acid transport protein
MATTAQGAGFAISDKSVSALGNAFAGASAVADDASAVYNNPATLTQLHGSTLSLAVHHIRGSARFTDSASTISGPGEETATTVADLPNAYYVTDYFGPELRAGIGLYAPFGLGLAYDEDWKGRYHTIESKLRTINISPTLAYRAGAGLSLGASLDLQYAEARLEQAVDFGLLLGTPQLADGRQVLKGDSWAYGISLGVAYELTGRTKLGAVWHGPVSHEMSGSSEFHDVPLPLAALVEDGDARVTLDLPETVSVGLSHAVTDRLTLLADYTWTGWGRFEELRIELDSGETVLPQEWEDAGRYSLALNYRLTPAWLLRAGVAYDKTPVPNAELRSPRMPDGDRAWYTVGFNWAPQATLSVDLAYAYIPADDIPISNTDAYGHTLDGSYDLTGEYLSAQLNWTF